MGDKGREIIVNPASVSLPDDIINHQVVDSMDTVGASIGPRVRIYSPGHKGLFVVYIRASKSQTLRHLQISKYLFGKYGSALIGKVVQLNNHKLKVEFKSAEAANSLVRDSDSLFAPYRVYIPADQVEVEGIVRLSTEDPVSDLLLSGRGQFSDPGITEVSIIDVFRFEQVSYDGAGKVTNKTPTSLVRVTFPGKLLPRRVVLHGLLIPVEPYKRKVMFCENCLRTGHTEKFCVVKPKCAKCGADHKTSVCQQIPATVKCFVCGTAHDPNDRKVCPKIKQANAIHQRQSKRKIFQSYADAVRQRNTSSNHYDLLSVDEDEEETETEEHSIPLKSVFRGTKRRKTFVASASGDGLKARPTSVMRSSVKDCEPSTSSAGRSREDINKTLGPKKALPKKTVTPKEANRSNQSFILTFRPLLSNFVEYLPIDTSWKELIHTALNFLFDTLYPLLSPFITSLISKGFNGY